MISSIAADPNEDEEICSRARRTLSLLGKDIRQIDDQAKRQSNAPSESATDEQIVLFDEDVCPDAIRAMSIGEEFIISDQYVKYLINSTLHQMGFARKGNPDGYSEWTEIMQIFFCKSV